MFFAIACHCDDVSICHTSRDDTQGNTKKRNKMTTRSADQCRLLSNGRIPAWLRGCVEHIQAVTRVLPRTFRKFARYCIWRRG